MSTESCLPVDGQPVRFAVVEGCCEDERDGVFHSAWSAAGPGDGARWAFVSDRGEPFRDQVVEWRGRVAAAARKRAARGRTAEARIPAL